MCKVHLFVTFTTILHQCQVHVFVSPSSCTTFESTVRHHFHVIASGTIQNTFRGSHRLSHVTASVTAGYHCIHSIPTLLYVTNTITHASNCGSGRTHAFHYLLLLLLPIHQFFLLFLFFHNPMFGMCSWYIVLVYRVCHVKKDSNIIVSDCLSQ